MVLLLLGSQGCGLVVIKLLLLLLHLLLKESLLRGSSWIWVVATSGLVLVHELLHLLSLLPLELLVCHQLLIPLVCHCILLLLEHLSSRELLGLREWIDSIEILLLLSRHPLSLLLLRWVEVRLLLEVALIISTYLKTLINNLPRGVIIIIKVAGWLI